MENTSLSLILPSAEGLSSLEGTWGTLTGEYSHREQAESKTAQLANERVRLWLELRDLTPRPTSGKALVHWDSSGPTLSARDRELRAATEAFVGDDLRRCQSLDARFYHLTQQLLSTRAQVDELIALEEAVA